MDEHDENVLADVINQEPIVFMDCTQSEIAASFLIGGLTGLSTGIGFGVLIGFVMFGLVIGLMLAVGISYVSMNWLKNVRQKYYLTWLGEKKFLLAMSISISPTRQYIDQSRRYGKGARRG